jgi:hypothetical protein
VLAHEWITIFSRLWNESKLNSVELCRNCFKRMWFFFICVNWWRSQWSVYVNMIYIKYSKQSKSIKLSPYWKDKLEFQKIFLKHLAINYRLNIIIIYRVKIECLTCVIIVTLEITFIICLSWMHAVKITYVIN